jgi:hypothetical protein
MPQAELYRSYAEACVRAAQNAANEAERPRWIGMAQHWLQWGRRGIEEAQTNRGIGRIANRVPFLLNRKYYSTH